MTSAVIRPRGIHDQSLDQGNTNPIMQIIAEEITNLKYTSEKKIFSKK